MVGEVEQAFDGGLVDVGGQFGEALGAESADAFQRQGELRVIGHLFEGFEGDPVGAAEAEFGHAGLVPVVEDGVDQVEGDFGLVHAGKVRRERGDSSGKRRMYTKSRTNPVHAGKILESVTAGIMRMIQARGVHHGGHRAGRVGGGPAFVSLPSALCPLCSLW